MKDLDKLWVGLVEDNKDPDRLGRVKIRVQSIYDEIPVEDIPWANPVKSLSGKSFEIPAIGKMMSVIFPNQNIYEPYYMFSDHYNVNIQNRLNDLSDDEYVNYVALLLEHRTQIYADDTNLTLDYQYNKITIDNSNINFELKDASQKLNIGCKVATQQAVLGTRFFEWMDKFVNKLVQPSSLVGNLNAPVLKPEIDQLLVQYQLLRKDFVSDYVDIVDNRKIQKLKRNPNSVAQMHDGIQINSGTVTDKELREKILEQFKNNNDDLISSQPSSIIKNQPVKSEDPQGNIVEGLSEIPFGFDENGGDVHGIKIAEMKGTETSFTNVGYYNLGDSVKSDEIEVLVPVILKKSPPDVTYVTPEEAAKIREKELKENGIVNYGNGGGEGGEDDIEYDVVSNESDPDDILAGNISSDPIVDDDDIEYYDENGNTWVYIAPDNSSYIDKSNKTAPAATTATSTSFKGKSKTVPGPPEEVITNGSVPEKYMSKIKVGGKNGALNSNARLEKHAAKWFEKLNEAYYKKFGVYIYVTDSFRTYEGQVACKRKWTDRGQPHKAATPGTSLHGWGVAVDIGDATKGAGGSINFGSTTYEWLLQNAPKYKFNNPSWARQGSKNPEPWHWEYQGSDYCSVVDI